MKNINFSGKQKLTSYRKIAISSWRHPRDPSTYSMLDLPISPVKDFLNTFEDKSLTITHFTAKVIAHCMEKFPEFNHVLRFGRLYKRDSIDVFITTLIKNSKGTDLSGFIIQNADSMPIEEMAALSKERVGEMRRNEHLESLKIQKLINPMPPVLLKYIFKIQDFFHYTMNKVIPFVGFKDMFGSVMISNIGALGIDNAFIPLSPYSRCPLIIGIGKPRKIAVVKNDEVVPEECVNISFTFDHRYGDGAHGAKLIRRFKKIFSNPSAYKQIFDKEDTNLETQNNKTGVDDD